MKEIRTSYKDLLKIANRVRGRMVVVGDDVHLITTKKAYIAKISKKVS